MKKIPNKITENDLILIFMKFFPFLALISLQYVCKKWQVWWQTSIF